MNPAAPSEARARLDAIVKAYDVRGIVGEGLTEQSVEALGAGFVDEVGAAGARGRRRARHARLLARIRGGLRARRQPRAAPTSWRSGSARPTRATSPPGRCTRRRRCSPRATTPPPTTASSSRAPAPRASRSTPGLAAIRDRAGDYLDEGIPDAATPGAVTTADVLADYAGLPALARRPLRHPPPQDRRRRRQRHGRAHRPRRARRGRRPAGAAARDRAALLRARRHLPEPRGEPARAGEPRRPAARGGRARRRPRPGLRRRRRPLLRGRRDRAAR